MTTWLAGWLAGSFAMAALLTEQQHVVVSLPSQLASSPFSKQKRKRKRR